MMILKKVDLSIIIPCIDRANFLAPVLHGLAKHSYHNLHVTIVNSLPVSDHIGDYPDYYNSAETGTRYVKYNTIKEMLNANPEIVEKLRINLIDVTEEVSKWHIRYSQGQIFQGNANPFGGADTAWKNNYALKLVNTPWVISDWDDDFYPSPDWDRFLIEAAEDFEKKTVFLPRHIQPFVQQQIDSMEENGDTGFYGQSWLKIPSSRAWLDTHDRYVTEEEWLTYCQEHGSDGVIVEPCAKRFNCHYSPFLFRTEEFISEIGEYSYQGTGYELEIDDRCRDLGFQKVSPNRSFMLHKGYVPKLDSEV